jgi:hypothetical protein
VYVKLVSPTMVSKILSAIILSVIAFTGICQKLDSDVIIKMNGTTIKGTLDTSFTGHTLTSQGISYPLSDVRFVLKNGIKYANTQHLIGNSKFANEARKLQFIKPWKASTEFTLYLFVFKTPVGGGNYTQYKTEWLFAYSNLNGPLKVGKPNIIKNDMVSNRKSLRLLKRYKRVQAVRIVSGISFFAGFLGGLSVFENNTTLGVSMLGSSLAAAIVYLIANNNKGDNLLIKAFDTFDPNLKLIDDNVPVIYVNRYLQDNR